MNPTQRCNGRTCSLSPAPSPGGARPEWSATKIKLEGADERADSNILPITRTQGAKDDLPETSFCFGWRDVPTYHAIQFPMKEV